MKTSKYENIVYNTHNIFLQREKYDKYKLLKKYPLMITKKRLFDQFRKTKPDIEDTCLDDTDVDYGFAICVDKTFDYDVAYNKHYLNKIGSNRYTCITKSDGVFGFYVNNATYANFTYMDPYCDIKIEMKEYKNTGTFILPDFTYDTPLFIDPCVSRIITIDTDGDNICCNAIWINFMKIRKL